MISCLKEFRKELFSEMLLLIETMSKRNSIVDLQEWMGYDRVYTIDPIGRSCGITLFWKNRLEVEFKLMDKNLLDVHVLFGSYNFFVSCVYGDPSGNRKQYLWKRFSRIGTNRRESWCMFGNFNEILHNGDTIGGPDRSDAVYEFFNQMLKTCDMMELPSSGNKFT